MDRVAIFVDAGYLFAQGSKELCGAKLPRGSIRLDHAVLSATLKEFAERLSGLPLLRIVSARFPEETEPGQRRRPLGSLHPRSRSRGAKTSRTHTLEFAPDIPVPVAPSHVLRSV